MAVVVVLALVLLQIAGMWAVWVSSGRASMSAAVRQACVWGWWVGGYTDRVGELVG